MILHVLNKRHNKLEVLHVYSRRTCISKRRIDFDNIDKQKVVILCQNLENVNDIKLQLEAKRYKVAIEISITNFMIQIEKNKPGFVLISKSLKSGMALQLPTFLQRKFKVPVMMFTEREVHAHLNEHINEGPKTENNGSKELPIEIKSKKEEPEILHLQTDKIEELVDKMSGFEEAYKKQFWAASPGALKIADKSISKFEEKILKPQELKWSDQKELELHSLKIKDPSGEGYFIMALPEVSQELKEKMFADLESQVQLHLGIEAKIEKLTNRVKYSQYKKITENSNKILKGIFANQELILAYTKEIPEADLTAVQVMEDAFMVPIEFWWTEIPLNFRVYHYMPVNNKRLLYVKPGKMLQLETYNRFKRRGVKQMLIPADELDAYRRLQELAVLSSRSLPEALGTSNKTAESPLAALQRFVLEDDDDGEAKAS